MRLHCREPRYWVDRLENGDWFALAGYSDAEWCCVLGLRAGERTGLGQVLDPAHGELLADVLRRRAGSDRFLFAVPRCILEVGYPIFGDGCIDWWLGSRGVRMEAYERDSATDDLARATGLFPLIHRLRQMRVTLVGPEALGRLRDVPGMFPFRHVPISTPNLHREPGGIDAAVARARLSLRGPGDPASHVCLVSAGVSAAIIIDRLFDHCRGSYLIDCGSVWDAFVGIGGQRQWRAELYADKAAWRAWVAKNLTGE